MPAPIRRLLVAYGVNLKLEAELLSAAQGAQITLCDGQVDRSKLELYLASQQFDEVHFLGHGNLSILEYCDGALEVQDLLSMLAKQTRLKFVVITACLSTRVGSEIHNTLCCPVVMCQAEIHDDAALRFSETFYRSLRAYPGDLHRAVAAGRATLAKLYPADADIVTLLNGDMPTARTADAHAVDAKLAALRADFDNQLEQQMLSHLEQAHRATAGGVLGARAQAACLVVLAVTQLVLIAILALRA